MCYHTTSVLYVKAYYSEEIIIGPLITGNSQNGVIPDGRIPIGGIPLVGVLNGVISVGGINKYY